MIFWKASFGKRVKQLEQNLAAGKEDQRVLQNFLEAAEELTQSSVYANKVEIQDVRNALRLVGRYGTKWPRQMPLRDAELASAIRWLTGLKNVVSEEEFRLLYAWTVGDKASEWLAHCPKTWASACESVCRAGENRPASAELLLLGLVARNKGGEAGEAMSKRVPDLLLADYGNIPADQRCAIARTLCDPVAKAVLPETTAHHLPEALWTVGFVAEAIGTRVGGTDRVLLPDPKRFLKALACVAAGELGSGSACVEGLAEERVAEIAEERLVCLDSIVRTQWCELLGQKGGRSLFAEADQEEVRKAKLQAAEEILEATVQELSGGSSGISPEAIGRVVNAFNCLAQSAPLDALIRTEGLAGKQAELDAIFANCLEGLAEECGVLLPRDLAGIEAERVPEKLAEKAKREPSSYPYRFQVASLVARWPGIRPDAASDDAIKLAIVLACLAGMDRGCRDKTEAYVLNLLSSREGSPSVWEEKAWLVSRLLPWTSEDPVAFYKRCLSDTRQLHRDSAIDHLLAHPQGKGNRPRLEALAKGWQPGEGSEETQVRLLWQLSCKFADPAQSTEDPGFLSAEAKASSAYHLVHAHIATAQGDIIAAIDHLSQGNEEEGKPPSDIPTLEGLRSEIFAKAQEWAEGKGTAPSPALDRVPDMWFWLSGQYKRKESFSDQFRALCEVIEARPSDEKAAAELRELIADSGRATGIKPSALWDGIEKLSEAGCVAEQRYQILCRLLEVTEDEYLDGIDEQMEVLRNNSCNFSEDFAADVWESWVEFPIKRRQDPRKTLERLREAEEAGALDTAFVRKTLAMLDTGLLGGRESPGNTVWALRIGLSGDEFETAFGLFDRLTPNTKEWETALETLWEAIDRMPFGERLGLCRRWLSCDRVVRSRTKLRKGLDVLSGLDGLADQGNKSRWDLFQSGVLLLTRLPGNKNRQQRALADVSWAVGLLQERQENSRAASILGNLMQDTVLLVSDSEEEDGYDADLYRRVCRGLETGPDRDDFRFRLADCLADEKSLSLAVNVLIDTYDEIHGMGEDAKSDSCGVIDSSKDEDVSRVRLENLRDQFRRLASRKGGGLPRIQAFSLLLSIELHDYTRSVAWLNSLLESGKSCPAELLEIVETRLRDLLGSETFREWASKSATEADIRCMFNQALVKVQHQLQKCTFESLYCCLQTVEETFAEGGRFADPAALQRWRKHTRDLVETTQSGILPKMPKCEAVPRSRIEAWQGDLGRPSSATHSSRIRQPYERVLAGLAEEESAERELVVWCLDRLSSRASEHPVGLLVSLLGLLAVHGRKQDISIGGDVAAHLVAQTEPSVDAKRGSSSREALLASATEGLRHFLRFAERVKAKSSLCVDRRHDLFALELELGEIDSALRTMQSISRKENGDVECLVKSIAEARDGALLRSQGGSPDLWCCFIRLYSELDPKQAVDWASNALCTTRALASAKPDLSFLEPMAQLLERFGELAAEIGEHYQAEARLAAAVTALALGLIEPGSEGAAGQKGRGVCARELLEELIADTKSLEVKPAKGHEDPMARSHDGSGRRPADEREWALAVMDLVEILCPSDQRSEMLALQFDIALRSGPELLDRAHEIANRLDSLADTALELRPMVEEFIDELIDIAPEERKREFQLFQAERLLRLQNVTEGGSRLRALTGEWPGMASDTELIQRVRNALAKTWDHGCGDRSLLLLFLEIELVLGNHASASSLIALGLQLQWLDASAWHMLTEFARDFPIAWPVLRRGLHHLHSDEQEAISPHVAEEFVNQAAQVRDGDLAVFDRNWTEEILVWASDHPSSVSLLKLAAGDAMPPRDAAFHQWHLFDIGSDSATDLQERLGDLKRLGEKEPFASYFYGLGNLTLFEEGAADESAREEAHCVWSRTLKWAAPGNDNPSSFHDVCWQLLPRFADLCEVQGEMDLAHSLKVRQARLERTRQCWGEAIRTWRSARHADLLRIGNPKTPQDAVKLSEIQRLLLEPEPAVKHLQYFLSLKKTNGKERGVLLSELGRNFAQQNRHDLAENCYRQASKTLSPGTPVEVENLFCWAASLSYLQKTQEARDALNAVLVRDANHSGAASLLKVLDLPSPYRELHQLLELSFPSWQSGLLDLLRGMSQDDG